MAQADAADTGTVQAAVLEGPVETSNDMRIPLQGTPQVNTTRVVGAALLTYCVDPQWGKLYFLIGRERHSVQWPQGSDKWSYFGGRPLGRSEGAEHTAAREFHEETLGLVRYFSNDALPRQGHDDIAASLIRGEFTFQITMWLDRPKDGVPPFGIRCTGAAYVRTYVTFVKQVPWDPDAVRRFAQARHTLSSLPRWKSGAGDLDWLLSHPAVCLTGQAHKRAGDQMPGTAAVCRRQFMECAATAPPKSGGGMCIAVNKDFLEKHVLGLWSVPQLHRVLQHSHVRLRKGAPPQYCRPSFLQCVSLVLNELSFYEPSVMEEQTSGGRAWV